MVVVGGKRWFILSKECGSGWWNSDAKRCIMSNKIVCFDIKSAEFQRIMRTDHFDMYSEYGSYTLTIGDLIRDRIKKKG